MPPNWDMKHWSTGKPVTLAEAFGFRKNIVQFPSLQPQLPAFSASSQHPLQVDNSSNPAGSGIPQANVGPGMKNFATGVLKGLGAPVNAVNIRSIESWAQREGGGGTNNPLNTTLQEPGSTQFNGVGVQNYPTRAEGVNATVNTLYNGNYNDIVSALKSGKGLMGKTFTGLSIWSGGGYNSVG